MTTAKSNVHDRINFKGTIEAWAKYTIRDWAKEMNKRKIGVSGGLEKSFRYQLRFRGDEPQAITFQFLYYGRFVDMGVGNGVKVGDVGELKESRRLLGKKNVDSRKAKKWFNSPFYYNFNKLSDIIAEKYARRIALDIVEFINN